MSRINRIALSVLALFLALACAPALAQNQNNNNNNNNDGVQHAYTAGDIQAEERTLAHDMDDPNYDYSLVPGRIRGIFQDMGQLRQSMDPDAFQQFAMQLRMDIMPVIMRNQAKLQMAFLYDYVKGLQEPLGCSDDEFAALRPSLIKLAQAAQNSQVNMFAAVNRPNGNNNNGQQQQRAVALTPIQQAATDLQTALDDPGSTPDSISSKVQALRLAKDKAQQDLRDAREQLRALLTIRQEAVLVSEGLLD